LPASARPYSGFTPFSCRNSKGTWQRQQQQQQQQQHNIVICDLIPCSTAIAIRAQLHTLLTKVLTMIAASFALLLPCLSTLQQQVEMACCGHHPSDHSQCF
jgi:hypothetical protein